MKGSEPRPLPANLAPYGRLFPLFAVAAVAFALRGPITSVGPLLAELRTDLGLGTAAFALLPALPVLCFGLVAPFAPAVAVRMGLHRGVLAGLIAAVAGLVLRSAGTPGLFAGTLLLGAGIAVVNVLLPAVVKADFPDRLPLGTALTTSALALSASLGAGLAEPLRAGTGSPVSSLTLWLLPAVAGLLMWLPLTRGERGQQQERRGQGALRLMRDRTALAVTIFFGLQALAFYTMLAWLPSVLTAAGVPVADAGAMLAVAAFTGAPMAFIVPRLAARRAEQGSWVLVVAAPSVLGLVGLLLAPGSAPWIWSILLGLGTGGAFPLALTLVVLRSRDAAQAARLSAAAQGLGYLLASTGPFFIGVLHATTGTWTPSLAVLLALLFVQVLVGRSAARNRLVTG
jgi:CP family cyanate transporter-like MFS transporter